MSRVPGDEYTFDHLQVGRDLLFYQVARSTDIRKLTKVRAKLPLENLPKNDNFYDRENELNFLQNHLGPEKIVTLCASGGMGKTALVAQLVWNLTEGLKKAPPNFPHGVVAFSFYGGRSTKEALAHIAIAFGVKTEDAKESPEEMAQRMLHGRTALILLDGVEESDCLDEVLDIRGECGVIITSRDRLYARGNLLELNPLPEDSSIEILRTYCEDDSRDTEGLIGICKEVGGLPLALWLAAGQMMAYRMTPQEFHELLEQSTIELLHIGKQQKKSVRVMLEKSFMKLDPISRKAAQVISHLTFAPFCTEAVAAGMDQYSSAAPMALGNLSRINILKREGVYWKLDHTLILDYFQEIYNSSPIIFGRLKDFYLGLLKPDSENENINYERLDCELGQMMGLIKNLLLVEEWRQVDELANEITKYLQMQGHTLEWTQVCQWGEVAAKKMADRTREGYWSSRLGQAYLSQKNYKGAIDCFLLALKVARETQNFTNEVDNLSSLGEAYWLSNEKSRAIESWLLSVNISNKIGYSQCIGKDYGNLGLAYCSEGDINKGIHYFRLAYGIAKKDSDEGGQVNHLINLGDAFLSLGNIAEAIKILEEALKFAQKNNDRTQLNDCLGRLAKVYVTKEYFEGSHEKGRSSGMAILYYEKILSDARDINDRQTEGRTLTSIGLFHLLRERYDKALAFLYEALEITREVNDNQCERDTLANLGWAYYKLGQYDLSVKQLEKALQINLVIGDQQAKEKILENIEIAKQKVGKQDDEFIWQQCLVKISNLIGQGEAERLFLIAQFDEDYDAGIRERAWLVTQTAVDRCGNDIASIVNSVFQEFGIN